MAKSNEPFLDRLVKATEPQRKQLDAYRGKIAASEEMKARLLFGIAFEQIVVGIKELAKQFDVQIEMPRSVSADKLSHFVHFALSTPSPHGAKSVIEIALSPVRGHTTFAIVVRANGANMYQEVVDRTCDPEKITGEMEEAILKAAPAWLAAALIAA